jgi:hypothetical protein
MDNELLSNLLPLAVVVLVVVGVSCLHLYLRGTAVRRVWTEAAVRTGCTFGRDESTGSELVRGTYRGREVVLDTDLGGATTRITVQCRDPSGLFLSLVPVGPIEPDEMLRPVSRGVDYSLPGGGPLVVQPALGPVHDIVTGFRELDERFVVQSRQSAEAVRLVAAAMAGAERTLGGALTRENVSVMVDGEEVRLVFGRLLARRNDVGLLLAGFNLAGDLADTVDKLEH